MNLIKEYREKLNMTQKDLAEKVNSSVKTIQGIEQNRRRPGGALSIKLFKTLKIPFTKLEFFLNSYTTK